SGRRSATSCSAAASGAGCRRWSRRRGTHPPRLLADVLAARNAGAVLRRGDRAGGGPVAPGPHERTYADGVGPRGDAAPRPRVAADVDGAADPPPPRVLRAGLGRDDDPR